MGTLLLVLQWFTLTQASVRIGDPTNLIAYPICIVRHPVFLSTGLEADNIFSKPAFPPLLDHPQVVGASLIVHASAKTPYSLKVSQCVLCLNVVKTKSPVPLLSHLSALSRLY